jgi:hypothetical protein
MPNYYNINYYMSSTIFQLKTDKIAAITTNIFSIESSDLSIIAPTDSPLELNSKTILHEKVSIAKIFNKKLYVVINSSLYQYFYSKKNPTEAESKILIGNIPEDPQDIEFINDRFYFLYPKRIEVYSAKPWKIIDRIKVSATLDSFIKNGTSLYVKNEEKIYKLEEGFIAELLSSSVAILDASIIKESSSCFLLQYSKSIRIYDAEIQEERFSADDYYRIDSVFQLNKDIIITHNKESNLIKFYDWTQKHENLSDLYIYAIDTQFELHAEDDILYFYSKVTGWVCVVFYKDYSFRYSEVNIGCEIDLIYFVVHRNSIDQDCPWEGDFYIEFVVQSNGTLKLFLFKSDLDQNFGVFYTQESDKTVLQSNPKLFEDTYNLVIGLLHKSNIYNQISNATSKFLSRPKPSITLQALETLLKSEQKVQQALVSLQSQLK